MDKQKILEDEGKHVSNYIPDGVNSVVKYLQNENDIETKEESVLLSLKGQIATHLNELHCLVFSDLIEKNVITNMSATDMILLFSCFTNVNVPEDKRDINHNVQHLSSILSNIKSQFEKYLEIECYNNFQTGMDYNMHYDLMHYLEEWVEAQSEQECKIILQRVEEEKDIFLGDFVKALLRINNIVFEMESIAQMIENIPFLHELNKIRSLTLKYVVTNQSLYV